ncbi:unnamed protein product [Durusdinium trenchii]|uniref:Calmodulin-lysine N-methyltransferase n=1 Tax=Durusdinium trenchii TaxID=1381693 RepID=A0ABP0RNM5_9DINO
MAPAPEGSGGDQAAAVKAPVQHVMSSDMDMTRHDFKVKICGGYEAQNTTISLGSGIAVQSRDGPTHPRETTKSQPVTFDGGHRYVVHAPRPCSIVDRCCPELNVPNVLVSVYDKDEQLVGQLAGLDCGDYVCCEDKDIALKKVLDGDGKQLFAIRRASTCIDMCHCFGRGCPFAARCFGCFPKILLQCPHACIPRRIGESCSCVCNTIGIRNCCIPEDDGWRTCCPGLAMQCQMWYGIFCCCCSSTCPFEVCMGPCIQFCECDRCCQCELPTCTWCKVCACEWPGQCLKCNCLYPEVPCLDGCCMNWKFDMGPGIWQTPVDQPAADKARVSGVVKRHQPTFMHGIDSVSVDFLKDVTTAERLAFSSVMYWESMNQTPFLTGGMTLSRWETFNPFLDEKIPYKFEAGDLGTNQPVDLPAAPWISASDLCVSPANRCAGRPARDLCTVMGEVTMRWQRKAFTFRDETFQVEHFDVAEAESSSSGDDEESLQARLQRRKREAQLQRCEAELGACLWIDTNRAALRLLEEWRSSYRGLRTLELGAGAGACGIALAYDGATSTVSDVEALLPLLQRNLELNELHTAEATGVVPQEVEGIVPTSKRKSKEKTGSSRRRNKPTRSTMKGSCQAVAVEWEKEALHPTLPEKAFDLIVVCDCLYENRDSWAALQLLLERLPAEASGEPSGEPAVLLASAALRKPFLEAFVAQLAKAGFTLLQKQEGGHLGEVCTAILQPPKKIRTDASSELAVEAH